MSPYEYQTEVNFVGGQLQLQIHIGDILFDLNFHCIDIISSSSFYCVVLYIFSRM